MVVIGRRFVGASENKNQAEATIRYGLTRVRENGESIALLGGEGEERYGLDPSFGRGSAALARAAGAVGADDDRVAGELRVLSRSCRSSSARPSTSPGEMTLGEVMQASSAFVTVHTRSTGWSTTFPRLAEWTARPAASPRCSPRSTGSSSDRTEATAGSRAARPTARRSGCRNLSVTLDDGSAVVDEADVDIARGEKVLVVGESGTGKSTLVRAISGLWPWGIGRDPHAGGRHAAADAAGTVRAARHAAARRDLSRRTGRRRRRRAPLGRSPTSGSATSSIASTRTAAGAGGLSAARSSGSRSRACSSRSPTSS
jgi:putative ATP-binding cassette transporter